MRVEIRPAEVTDVSALLHVRTSISENHLSRERLAELGIADASITDMIAASPCAWVATADAEIVGFSMIDVAEASLFAALSSAQKAVKSG